MAQAVYKSIIIIIYVLPYFWQLVFIEKVIEKDNSNSLHEIDYGFQ